MLPLFWTDKIPALQQLRIGAHFLRAASADFCCSSALESHANEVSLTNFLVLGSNDLHRLYCRVPLADAPFAGFFAGRYK
jgi:hypothetical protein